MPGFSSSLISRPLPENEDIYLWGDVTVESGVSFGASVIIQAAKGAKVVIRQGACIGAGSVFKVTQGQIEIGVQAVLGSGVLIFEQVSIGERAIIGYGSTLWQTDIPNDAVIPPQSLLGDRSRPVEFETNDSDSSAAEDYHSSTSTSESSPSSTGSRKSTSVSTPTPPVIGKAYVQDLLNTLFQR
ncbi:MAG: hypothetical protein AAGG02_02310 [Cyanobacteria bacterium P01_H01_bin.15]